MRIQNVKFSLKRFKPLFPVNIQLAGVKAWNAVEVPLGSIVERRTVMSVHRVYWPAAEVADFETAQVLGPRPDEVQVEVAYTVMSPGTERAQFLGLPGVYQHVRGAAYYPGYSGSGRVVAVGKRVTGLQVGDLVAGRIRHGTPEIVPASLLFKLPADVPLDQAAFIELGIIGLQSIRKAAIQPGESVIVLGQGLVGQMASRLARIAGAAPIVAAARSRSKAVEALMPDAADDFKTVDELGHESIGGFDVVIEATGDANIMPYACQLARPGGRVIGLGTPRGRGRIDLGQHDAPAGMTIIGAHISGMPIQDRSRGLWTYRQEGQLFVRLLADGRLALAPLITERHDPGDAGDIYEELRTGGAHTIGVVFDWQRYAVQQPAKKRQGGGRR